MKFKRAENCKFRLFSFCATSVNNKNAFFFEDKANDFKFKLVRIFDYV